MTLVKFENNDELYLIDNEDITEGAYLPNIKFATKKDLESFKKYGIKISNETTKDEIIKELINKKYSKEEAEDIVKDFIDDLHFLPQICDSFYCEDIVAKETIKELEKEGALFFNLQDDYFYNTLSNGEFYNYYIYWDGKNHKVEKIIEKYELQPEKIEELYEKYNTGFYKYYKIEDQNNETVIFRIWYSFYQGDLPVVSREWKQHRVDFEDILEYISSE